MATQKKATVLEGSKPAARAVAKKAAPAKKAPAKKPVAKKSVAKETVPAKTPRVLYRWECEFDGCTRHGRWIRAEHGGKQFGDKHVAIRTRRGQEGHTVRVVSSEGTVRG